MPHVDDLNDAVLVGLAVEDDAQAMYALSHADMRHRTAWEQLPQLERMNFCAMARVVRARYVAQANADAVDAARYRWLRADNAYAPEEACVTGGDELDALCDKGLRFAASTPEPKSP